MTEERWPEGYEDDRYVDYGRYLPPGVMDEGYARELMTQRLLAEAGLAPAISQNGLTLAELERVKPADRFEHPDIGRLNAAWFGLRSGATANYDDEVGGLYAAGRAALEVPEHTRGSAIFTPVIGAGMLGLEYLTGRRGAATEAYERTRDRMRAERKLAEEQYPLTTAGANLAGGLVLPLGAVRTPAQGARIGAIMGGVSGVGPGLVLG